MNKFLKFLVVLFLAIPISANALFDGCKDYFPNNKIPTTKQVGRDLCFDSFAVFYSPDTKKPIYVVEKLNKELLRGKHQQRTNLFYEEARLPAKERSMLDDYKHSGYDRGHNAPAGDMTNENAMAQSFSMANIMPQARENNRGIWAKSIENPTRKYALRAQGDIYVFTGSVGNAGTIGRDRVVIPTHLYKLVYDPAKEKAWAFWVENIDGAEMTPPISYEEIVKFIFCF